MKQTPAYDIANDDLLSLVPVAARRVIDVGCMLGSLARSIRRRSPDTAVTGIDIDPDYATAAAQHCTEAFSCDIERIDEARWDTLFPSDCWIFGDCLEHLRDPWRLLRNIRERIDPGGCLLVCLPNAQHWSVQWRLASGQFRYESSGLMDRTHLRWFTRKTLLEMLGEAGWQVETGFSRNLPTVAQQEVILGALRALALAGGFDADEAVRDAVPFQYVFKCIAA
ncbi:MAG TPA: class I SAM-dependent methyltransferase [Lichenihabitans sp.]|jgi:trans-aconitate methyltransferase|nr:class I SAM-dependent methyltransferase [Lichenihabitans sp.]